MRGAEAGHRAWQRRAFLGTAALSVGSLLAGCAGLGDPQSVQHGEDLTATPGRLIRTGSPTPVPSPTPTPTVRPAPSLVKVPAPQEAFTALPGEGSLVAWTVDDGTDSTVVRAYAEFARQTGTRLTLFATASYSSWQENAELLRPLVASGQIQIANHTWTHPDLTSLSDNGIVDELQRAHDRIGELFGVDARPFYRPPFGFHDRRVRTVAASLGYTAPTLWYGSFADSSLISAEEILRLGHEWLLPQHIVIGHLNHPPITTVFAQLAAIIAERGLTTVTLNDVFSSGPHP